MALNSDEEKLLQELQARKSEPEEDDNYEIEVYDTTQGKGARIPMKAGKSWLYDVFGIGEAPPAANQETENGDPSAGQSPKNSAGYFGRKSS